VLLLLSSSSLPHRKGRASREEGTDAEDEDRGVGPGANSRHSSAPTTVLLIQSPFVPDADSQSTHTTSSTSATRAEYSLLVLVLVLAHSYSHFRIFNPATRRHTSWPKIPTFMLGRRPQRAKSILQGAYRRVSFAVAAPLAYFDKRIYNCRVRWVANEFCRFEPNDRSIGTCAPLKV
jgi:hypothetical protein